MALFGGQTCFQSQCLIPLDAATHAFAELHDELAPGRFKLSDEHRGDSKYDAHLGNGY